MRIAILQFSPTLNAVPANLARADALLLAAAPRLANLDLLVLPELAFTGYNFQSLEEIRGVLEVKGKGASAEWARRTARRLGAVVCVGYAEKGEEEDGGEEVPDGADGTVEHPDQDAAPHRTGRAKTHPPNYNSLLTVSPAGAILAHYRKTHLYSTDESWATESPSRWLTVDLPLPTRRPATAPRGSDPATPPPGSDPATAPTTAAPTTRTAFAICMDLNPHHFTAPWDSYELATHARASDASLLICSMAWLTRAESATQAQAQVQAEPDREAVGYWLERLRPLWRAGAGRETVVVLANRSGEEAGGARYVGSSCVVGLGGEGGRCWGGLGRGVEGVLVVDTGGEAGWRVEAAEGGEGGG